MIIKRFFCEISFKRERKLKKLSVFELLTLIKLTAKTVKHFIGNSNGTRGYN